MSKEWAVYCDVDWLDDTDFVFDRNIQEAKVVLRPERYEFFDTFEEAKAWSDKQRAEEKADNAKGLGGLK